MEIEIEDRTKIVKVAINGRLVASCVEELKDRVTKRVEKKPNLVFDLAKMTHIDSSGLGALVFFLQKCRALGGDCRLANLQARPRIVFDLTKVCDIFEIYNTMEEAVEAFKTPKSADKK